MTDPFLTVCISCSWNATNMGQGLAEGGAVGLKHAYVLAPVIINTHFGCLYFQKYASII